MSSISESWAHIVALDSQPVLRNLLITQGYHELSEGFARMLGPENVTWFTFASWSSKVVGQFIQNDELPGLVRAWIEGAEDQRMQRLNTQLRSLHTEPGDTQHFALDAAVRFERVLGLRVVEHSVDTAVRRADFTLWQESQQRVRIARAAYDALASDSHCPPLPATS